MKIIVDGRLLSNRPTGIGRYTIELIKALIEKYSFSNIYVLVNPGYLNPDQYNTIETVLKPYNPLHFIFFPFFVYRLDYTTFYSPFYSGLCFRLKKDKHILTIHDLMYIRIKNYFSTLFFLNLFYKWIFNFIVKRSIKSCDQIICVSETTKKDLKNLFNKDSLVIREGVNQLIFSGFSQFDKELNSRKSLRYLKKDEYFLYVGNFRRQKNISFLIEAYLKSKSSKKLILAGDKGNFNLPGANSDNRIKGIHFTGILEDSDIHWLFQNCSAFIMPSLYEGFGLPILEAYCAGARIFSSDQGALKEFSDLKIHFFSPFKVHDLIYLMENAERLEKPDLDDIRIVKENYSWKKQTDIIITAIENIKSTGKVAEQILTFDH